MADEMRQELATWLTERQIAKFIEDDTLTDQQIARPKDSRAGLCDFAFYSDKPLGWSMNCLADCFSVG